MPSIDGSAEPFAKVLLEAGIEEQQSDRLVAFEGGVILEADNLRLATARRHLGINVVVHQAGIGGLDWKCPAE